MKKGDDVLREIEAASAKKFLPIIGREKGKLLEKLVRSRRPLRVLEIGTLVGYSGILTARSLPEGGKLITLELSSENAKIADGNFKRAGVAGKVKIVVGDARKSLPKLKGSFDFVFIDAEKRQYISYLKLLEERELLSKGACLLADNAKIFAHEMRGYLDYVRNSGSYRSRYYDFGRDGMELSCRA